MRPASDFIYIQLSNSRIKIKLPKTLKKNKKLKAQIKKAGIKKGL